MNGLSTFSNQSFTASGLRAWAQTVSSSLCQGTPLDFRPEPFRSELPLASTTLRDRFHAGSTLSTFVDSCGQRVGGLVGDSGHLVETSAASTSVPSQHLLRVAKASETATQGRDSPWGIISSSDSGHNLGGAPDKSDHASPDEGSMKNEDGSFTIKASELSKLRKEYVDLMNLKENGEIVLAEAMEATKWLNTVFNQIRTSMNRMSPMMKDIFLVPKRKSSGKTIEYRNNWACDKAATKAATK
ncbi:hypothetical protein M422DRAFT_248956 [Sphaerobolus stellatus SS14]|nr:hypothetical protein M422DRAFT_248956 [Sphaerobolus stellatus SS14]